MQIYWALCSVCIYFGPFTLKNTWSLRRESVPASGSAVVGKVDKRAEELYIDLSWWLVVLVSPMSIVVRRGEPFSGQP